MKSKIKSKIFILLMFIGVICLAGIFIFGKAGLIDNMYRSKEITRLAEDLRQSKNELENMTKEYYRLSEMKEPTQAFLIEQGRKTKDIVVFKMNTGRDSSGQKSSSVLKEELLFFQSSWVALIILFLGCLGIYIIAYTNKKKRIKELHIEFEEGEEE